MKILFAEIKQEVSTFNPVPSTYEDFVVTRGGEFIATQRGLNTEVAGAASVLANRMDVEIVPTYSARAITSGGTLNAADWQRPRFHHD